jgi:putative PEP-CTERM system histidine kinase
LETFALYSYATSAVAYVFLLGLSLLRIKKSEFGTASAIIFTFTIIWAVYTVFVLLNNSFYIQDVFPAESIRNLAWFFFLSILISKQQFGDLYYLLRTSWQAPTFIVLILSIVVLELIPDLRYQLQQIIGFDFRPFVHIGFSLIGLILVEQLYRNAMQEQRWAIKFFCLGLALIFTFDFVLYSKTLLFKTLDMLLWEARGFINAISVPLFAISLNRLSKEQLKVQISNKVIFHSTVLLGAGLYLLLMSLAGYYIKIYGGSWGAIAQISFVILAIILMMVFFVSGKIRAWVKVFFSKHFFQHRYDYRDEWIKLSKKIAELDTPDDLSNLIVKTMANIVDSSGGGLWIKNDQGNYYFTAEQNFGEHSKQLIHGNEPFIGFLIKKQWVIDFVEFFNDPDIYAGLRLDKWHAELKDVWLIVPLFQKNKLDGFVVLTEPRVPRQIDWEDHDLLKTAGMQLANAYALTQISEDLSRSRQFEAYNRVSAFLVHDLKNLVAQISLIVKNSERHKRNPEFIDDSIETLENVVKKIDNLLSQLRKGNRQEINRTKIDLAEVLADVALQQSSNKPMVSIKMGTIKYWVLAEKEKMTAILGHLVQNAQEATDDNGLVQMEMSKESNKIIVKIIDTGSGMDEKFIQQRLFKPFDTTKGNAGMGIGVYEAQEYILQQSGHIDVISKIGKGTTFILSLPEAI